MHSTYACFKVIADIMCGLYYLNESKLSINISVLMLLYIHDASNNRNVSFPITFSHKEFHLTLTPSKCGFNKEIFKPLTFFRLLSLKLCAFEQSMPLEIQITLQDYYNYDKTIAISNNIV